MLLSQLLKKHCIFDLNQRCREKHCQNTHTKQCRFKTQIAQYIDDPTSIPGIRINMKELTKSVDFGKLKIKLIVCPYYLTSTKCFNEQGCRLYSIDILYKGVKHTAQICYQNISSRTSWITCSLHINFEIRQRDDEYYIIRPIFGDEKAILSKIAISKKTEVVVDDGWETVGPKRKKDRKVESVRKIEPVAGWKDVVAKRSDEIKKEGVRKKKMEIESISLPFTEKDLVDMKNQIMTRALMQLTEKFNDMKIDHEIRLKRNVELVDQLSATKHIRHCVQCENCRKPISKHVCNRCWVKSSPQVEYCYQMLSTM